MPDDGEGRAPRQRPGPASTTTASNGPAIVPGSGDPRPIGQLLAAWVGAKLEEVDDLVAEAHSRVEAIPDQRVLWSLVGEVTVLLRALELDVAELRKAARR